MKMQFIRKYFLKHFLCSLLLGMLFLNGCAQKANKTLPDSNKKVFMGSSDADIGSVKINMNGNSYTLNELEGMADDLIDKEFDTFDADKDGFITEGDMLLSSRVFTHMLDTDGDDVLSQSEFGKVSISNFVFGDNDKDGSGYIDQTEIYSYLMKAFSALVVFDNGDKKIARTEFKAAKKYANNASFNDLKKNGYRSVSN